MRNYLFALASLTLLTFTSCQRDSSCVWEDTKTASRYLHRGGYSLFNTPESHRLVDSDHEFLQAGDDEYLSLDTSDLVTPMERTQAQPAKDPGAKGSNAPSIEHFKNPGSTLAQIFQRVHFDTDQHVLRSRKDYDQLKQVANYLKKHSSLYVISEGHCDERASESYNLALATRRANFVRNQLVKYGVKPDQIYTISYGKGRPLIQGHTKAAYSKNRRVEFKVCDRKHKR